MYVPETNDAAVQSRAKKANSLRLQCCVVAPIIGMYLYNRVIIINIFTELSYRALPMKHSLIVAKILNRRVKSKYM